MLIQIQFSFSLSLSSSSWRLTHCLTVTAKEERGGHDHGFNCQWTRRPAPGLHCQEPWSLGPLALFSWQPLNHTAAVSEPRTIHSPLTTHRWTARRLIGWLVYSFSLPRQLFSFIIFDWLPCEGVRESEPAVQRPDNKTLSTFPFYFLTHSSGSWPFNLLHRSPPLLSCPFRWWVRRLDGELFHTLSPLDHYRSHVRSRG
jgi:hypothetical protein